MSPDLARLLHDAVGLVADVDVAPKLRTEVRRRRRRRIAAAAVVAVVAGVAAAGALAQRAGDEQEVVTTPPEESGAAVFEDSTGVVLLFDDGYDGVTALDPDTGIATRRVVEGQTAGDQSPRLHRSGDALIVGYGPPYAVPIGGGPSTPLAGDGLTVAVDAAEDGRVWVVERLDDGSVHTEVFRLVDVASGEVLGTWDSPVVDGFATVGVDGGLAIEHVSGALDLWRPDDEATTRIGDGRVLDASRDRMAWCALACSELHVYDVAAGRDDVVSAPSGEIRRVALSPDGRFLAMRRAVAGGERVSVIDAASGEELGFAEEAVDEYGGLGWSVDATQLFFHGRSDGAVTEVGRIDMTDGSVEVRTLPLDGVLGDVVVLAAPEADAFRGAVLGPPEACPPPSVQPSGRTGACSFRVTTPIAARLVDEDADLVVYMNPEATQAQIDAVAAALTASPAVGGFTYRGKDAAMAEFRELFAESPELVESVTPEVLPTSFRVVLADDDCAAVTAFESLPGVRTVIPTGSCT